MVSQLQIARSIKDIAVENVRRAYELVENIGLWFQCLMSENILSCSVNFVKAELDIIKLLLQADIRFIENIGSGIGGALATCIGGKMQFTSNLAFNAQIF